MIAEALAEGWRVLLDDVLAVLRDTRQGLTAYWVDHEVRRRPLGGGSDLSARVRAALAHLVETGAVERLETIGDSGAKHVRYRLTPAGREGRAQ